MVLNEIDLNFAKCKGYQYNNNGHTCNKLYSDIIEIQKTKILDITTITRIINSINKSCFGLNCNIEFFSQNRKNLISIIYNHIIKTDNYEVFLYKNSYFLDDTYYIFTISNKLENENRYDLIENILDKIISIDNNDNNNNNNNNNNYNYYYINNQNNHYYDMLKNISYINYVFELYKKNLIKINENLLINYIYNNFNRNLMSKNGNYGYSEVNKVSIYKNINTIISYFITNKNFNASNDNFIKCLVYDNFKNAQLMLTSTNVKIKPSSFSEYLNLLFKIDLSNINFDNITNCINFFVENNFNKNIDISELIFIMIKNNNLYTNQNLRQIRFSADSAHRIYEYIFNTLIDNGCKIKKDDLLTLLKNHIYIKNPQKCGINVNDDDISSLCYSMSFNPYGLKFKYTEKLLELESDKSGNLKKIKDICKTINPTNKCLEKSCEYRNNYATVKYFIDIKKLKTNIYCIANCIKSLGGSNYSYIVDAFYKDNDKMKVESIKPQIEPEIEPQIESDNISVCSNDTIKTTDSTKKKKIIIKKIIKRVVKKKTTNSKTEENILENTDETELKPKKVVKNKTTKLKTEEKILENTDEIESTKSTKSTKSEKIKIINLDEFTIPNNYNYKEKYKIKNTGKNIINSTENLNHISVRRIIFEYLKENNKLEHETELNNIKFKLKNIDKFISAYILEY